LNAAVVRFDMLAIVPGGLVDSMVIVQVGLVDSLAIVPGSIGTFFEDILCREL
jgi:hypothetical protein